MIAEQFQRLREWIGSTDRKKRYADEDEIEDPVSAADPHSWRDQHRTTIRTRVWRRRRTIGALLIGIVGAVIIASIYARRYFVGAFRNPILREVLKFAFVGGVMFVVGTRYQRNQIKRMDRLTVALPDGLVRFLGKYKQIDRPDSENQTVFVPYSGFSTLLHRPRRLQLRDMGDEMARQFAKLNRDPSDPLRIRIDDAISYEASTDFGREIAVLADSIRPDPWGHRTDVYCQPPQLAPKDRVQELAMRLQELVEQEIPNLDREIQILRDNLEDERQRRLEDEEEAIDRMIERQKDLSEAAKPEIVMGDRGQRRRYKTPAEEEEGN